MSDQRSNLQVKTRAYRFSLDVIHFIEKESAKRKIYYSLIDQLIRSSTSIGANIIEAKSSSSKKEFIRYLEIALKSANETKYWLCLFRDALMCDNEKISTLLKEVDEISKMIARSIITLKAKK
jgi:four helix bundle protein